MQLALPLDFAPDPVRAHGVRAPRQAITEVFHKPKNRKKGSVATPALPCLFWRSGRSGIVPFGLVAPHYQALQRPP